MFRALSLVPLVAMQMALQAVPTGGQLSIEVMLVRILEQLPLVAVIVWLWIRDSNRRDKADQAARDQYKELFEVMIAALVKGSSSADRIEEILSRRS